MKTLVSWNPTYDLRAMDDVLDRLFTTRTASGASILPVDVYEADGKFVIKAIVPGVASDALDIQVENSVLTIKGNHVQDSLGEEAKLYRRELSYGEFSRSIRLPKNLQLDAIDAQFKNGVVTISIPKVEEIKPEPIKINVRAE